jgi:spermidine synthase
MQKKSLILKLCLFATGVAGIMAEFVLSTLASYLLGNSIFQWSVIISLMLFAMGTGSYLSQHVRTHLLDSFIFTEFALSLVTAISAGVTYSIAAFTQSSNFFIYGLSFVIGVLIGLEIPLVTRINQHYETLRVNISSVMEYDYLGSLAGGLFFSFFALPYLGLTYTPIALGAVNFFVASLLVWKFKDLIHYKVSVYISFVFVFCLLVGLVITIKPIILYGEQKQYQDPIIYEEQTLYQKIVVTRWKDYYWLFLNRNLQFSTFDEERYHEPLVHPALFLAPVRRKVLVLGGGDGLAVREILKYEEVEKIVLVDLDPAMTELGREFYVFVEANKGALNDKRVSVINQDAFEFMEQSKELYDVIVVDLPDPRTVELTKLYSKNFYILARKHLSRYGIIVTQSCDILMQTKVFTSVTRTMEAAGFSVVPYHNFVPTMGDWGWNLGMKSDIMSVEDITNRLEELDLNNVLTKFLNRSAMIGMIHFGKGIIETKHSVKVSTVFHPYIYQYYREGYRITLD